MEKLIKVSIDLGNGHVKAKSDNVEFVMPSSIVLATNVAIEETNLGKNYSVFKVDETEFVAGVELENPNFIVDANDLIQSYSKNQNRYKSKVFKNLFIASIAKLVENVELEENEIIIVDVVTGLPSNDCNDHNKKIIRDFLQEKTHVVIVNKNNEIKFKVNKVAIMEQPLATLLNIAITNDKISKDFVAKNHIVLDFGAGTTILDTYFQGKRVDSKSETIESGMKDIYLKILNSLEEHRFMNISDIETTLKNKTDFCVGRTKIKYLNIYDLFKQYTLEFIEYTLRPLVDNIVNNNKRIQILITGGGSELMKGLFELDNTMYEFVEEPQLSAVRGMQKFNRLYVNNDAKK